MQFAKMPCDSWTGRCDRSSCFTSSSLSCAKEYLVALLLLPRMSPQRLSRCELSFMLAVLRSFLAPSSVPMSDLDRLAMVCFRGSFLIHAPTPCSDGGNRGSNLSSSRIIPRAILCSTHSRVTVRICHDFAAVNFFPSGLLTIRWVHRLVKSPVYDPPLASTFAAISSLWSPKPVRHISSDSLLLSGAPISVPRRSKVLSWYCFCKVKKSISSSFFQSSERTSIQATSMALIS